MIKSVIKEHKVHWFIFKAIVFEHTFHLLLDRLPATKILIETGIFLLFVSWVRLHVVTEQNWVSECLLFRVFKVLLNKASNNGIFNKFFVNLVKESITKDTHALVSPQTDKLGLGLNLVLSCKKKTFVNTG